MVNRRLAAAAIAAFGFTFGNAQAEDPALYDLWTMIDDTETMIAVSAHENAKIASVAAGKNAGGLDILTADEALASMKVLRQHIDNHSVERILANHKASDKKRVKIIQREVLEENDEKGSGHEVIIEQIEKDAEHKADAGAEIHIEKSVDAKSLKADSDKMDAAKKTVIQTNENGVGKKIVLVSGADAETARAFILEAEGLTEEERKAMISSLDL